MNLFYCSPRQRKMLKYLLITEEYVSGTKLSTFLGISDRTVRNDIGILNYILEQYNCQIISKRGKGYKLESKNKELLNNILSQYEGYKKQKDERVYEIITILLCSKNSVDLFELEEKLYISRTTLETEIQNMKKMIKSIYPSIDIRRKKSRIELIGNETTLRFLLNEIIMLKYDAKKQNLFITNDFFTNNDFEETKKIIESIAIKYSLNLDDSAIADISVYIIIAQIRLNLNKKIISINDKQKQENDKLYEASNDIYEKTIGKEIETNEYKQNEICQIAIKLSFVNLLNPTEKSTGETKKECSKQIIEIVESLILNIKNDYNLDLSTDDELFTGLAFHIRALINRVKYQQLAESPILEIIKKQYTFIFELSLHIYEIFKKVLNITLNESELSYIAAHIAAAIERMKLHYGESGVKTIIISHLKTSYTNLLISNLKNIFSSNIEIIGHYPVYKIQEALQEESDLILSTCKVEKELIDKKNIKYMQIGLVLSNEEQQKLAELIEETANEKIYLKSQNSNDNSNILNKFEKDLFFPNLNIKTKNDALSLISNAMYLKGYVQNDFLNKLIEREKLSNTVIDGIIAIPHPIRACSNETKIGVITTPQSIIWGDFKVKMIFVLAIKKDEKTFIRNFFKFINNLTKDKNNIDILINSKTYKEFIYNTQKFI